MKSKIEKNMKANIIGKKIIFFDVIESTQIEARKMAENKTENGTIIITNYQTNGIGTHNRKWYSEKDKNLAFTLIIYPKCTIRELDNFTVNIAQCLKNAIKNLYSYILDIKEPNDIIYNGKKLGGILTQIVTKGEKIKYSLIGIGFNVNGENFNEEIKNTATSLKIEFGKEFSRENILNEFCYNFEKYCIEKKII